MRKEIIKGFENYLITEYGQVVNIKTNKVLKPSYDGWKYLKVILCNNGVYKTMKIHRLLALHFIPNPENLPQVNHIDGKKDNNSLDNLEWCTAQQNVIHAHRTGLTTRDGKRSQKQIDHIIGLGKRTRTEKQIATSKENLKNYFENRRK